MTTVTLEEAQARLPELLEQLLPGLELTITREGQPVARLTALQPVSNEPRRPGSASGKLIIVAEDDEHLKDFSEYME